MNFPRIHNPISEVHFAGFRSDTLTLQRAGWQLSMERTMHMDAVRMAMKHEATRLFCLTHPVSMMEITQRNWGGGRAFTDVPSGIIFQVAIVGNDLRFQMIPMMGPVAFQAVDATPEFMDTKIVSFEDAIPFRPLNHNAPEIIIADKNVAELMEMALKLQDPKQKEIRERRRKDAWRMEACQVFRPGYEPARDIMAQVISIAG